MSPKSKSLLSPSKRELLLGALAGAVALATPQSRLLAASNDRPVKLKLHDGSVLEVHKQQVFLLQGGTKKLVKSGSFALGHGGHLEVSNGKIVSAALGPSGVFPRATWIQIHSPSGGGDAKPGAKDWLRSNKTQTLGH